MNKFIKCWVFILCILFILLILFTDRVNAETLTSIYINSNNLTNNSNSVTCNNGTCSLYFSFSSDITFSGTYQGVKGNIMPIATFDTQYYDLSGVSWSNICSSSQWVNSAQGGQYTITYADGTHASISGNEYDAYCSRYNSSYTSQSSISTSVIDNKPYIQLKVMQTHPNNYSTFSPCDVDVNGRFYCPIDSNIKNLHGFQVILGNSGYTNVFQVTLTRELQMVTSDTQQIINNNNSNTQTIIQEQQNINNSITSNDVTGNNSSSSITSIGNTFNTQEDFLLNLLTIPYTLWTSILNVFSNSCSPLDVGTMFNYHLVFPCIELNDFLGGIYATIIDVIFTAIIYSAFIRRVIKYFRELLTLDEHALITGGVKLW